MKNKKIIYLIQNDTNLNIYYKLFFQKIKTELIYKKLFSLVYKK